MNIDELNTVETSVETSVETWLEFCDFSMESDFYRLAFEHTGDAKKSAAFTLLRNYINTFAAGEKDRLQSDVEYFYKYASGFISELAPYRYSVDGYDVEIRGAYFGKIRQLLAAQKDHAGKVINSKRYDFIRTIVHFCSSLDFIIKIHDEYKQFLFREFPQIESRQRADLES